MARTGRVWACAAPGGRIRVPQCATFTWSDPYTHDSRERLACELTPKWLTAWKNAGYPEIAGTVVPARRRKRRSRIAAALRALTLL